jgi:UDP-4-amino-4,6-dideoxy-N-acetyl-beta-L-altrosamine N-acetyltransferase
VTGTEAGSRVRLVPLAEQHLDTTLRWVNDPEMMRLLGRAARVESDEHRRWFDQLKQRTDCRYFSVETTEAGLHVGNIWLWDIDTTHRKAEVRILFGNEAARGHGYGSEAIGLLADLAFDTMGLHRLFAYVFSINPRAKRAFERAGFTAEGMLRHDRRVGDEYVDVYLLGQLTSDRGGR